MNDDIFEVTRDEYVGFLDQINPKAIKTIVDEQDEHTTLKVYSKKDNTHFCSRIIQTNGTQHYYVYNMPLPVERKQPTPIEKIVLKDKEEVQLFFNLLSKATKQKANKK